jgi:hypothetical protein
VQQIRGTRQSLIKNYLIPVHACFKSFGLGNTFGNLLVELSPTHVSEVVYLLLSKHTITSTALMQL